MESFSEVVRSVVKSSEERLKNPFTSAFLIAFIACNWKPILIILLSAKTIEDKLLQVSEQYYDVWNLFLIPIIAALFYTLCLPYIMWFFDYITIAAVKGRSSKLFDARAIELDGRIKVAGKEVELENLRADYKDKADLNKKVSQLIEINSEKDEQISQLLDTVKSLDEKQASYLHEINLLRSGIKDANEEAQQKAILDTKYTEEIRRFPKEFIFEFLTFLLQFKSYPEKKDDPSMEKMNFYIGIGLIEEALVNNKTKYRITQKGLLLIRTAAI